MADRGRPRPVLLRDWLAEEACRHGRTIDAETEDFLRDVARAEQDEPQGPTSGGGWEGWWWQFGIVASGDFM